MKLYLKWSNMSCGGGGILSGLTCLAVEGVFEVV